MIPLRIHRDRTRELVTFFFPFLTERCLLKVREADQIKDVERKLAARVMWCLVQSAKLKFDRKLLTEANRFTVKLSDAEAIVLYQLLMAFPIDPKMVFQVLLRQEIVNFLFEELKL